MSIKELYGKFHEKASEQYAYKVFDILARNDFFRIYTWTYRAYKKGYAYCAKHVVKGEAL